MSRPQTPALAWAALRAGNARFTAGRTDHTATDLAASCRSTAVAAPFALVVSCMDALAGPEFLFDQGLGDLVVIRTAGQLLDSIGLASLEFAVARLGVRLVVVLGHDGCTAIEATLEAHRTGEMPQGRLRAITSGITPDVGSIRRGTASLREVDPDAVSTEHVRRTSRLLVEWSPVLAETLARGECAVVGAMQRRADGTVRLVESLGDVGDTEESVSPDSTRP